MIKCEVCGAQTHQHIFRCDEHQRCDDCGEKTGLIYMGRHELTCKACHKKRIEKRIAAFDGETDYQNDVVCPWCGHTHQDSFELDDSDDSMECDYCGKIFKMTRYVDVSYSTERAQ